MIKKDFCLFGIMKSVLVLDFTVCWKKEKTKKQKQKRNKKEKRHCLMITKGEFNKHNRNTNELHVDFFRKE